MSRLAATILIPQVFEPADTGRVTSMLTDMFDGVQETRKGRHWDFLVDNRNASRSVFPVTEKLAGYEAYLIVMSRLKVEMQEAFVVLFACSTETDRMAFEKIRMALVHEFNGEYC